MWGGPAGWPAYSASASSEAPLPPACGAACRWDTGALGQQIVPLDAFQAFYRYFAVASKRVRAEPSILHVVSPPLLRRLTAPAAAVCAPPPSTDSGGPPSDPALCQRRGRVRRQYAAAGDTNSRHQRRFVCMLRVAQSAACQRCPAGSHQVYTSQHGGLWCCQQGRAARHCTYSWQCLMQPCPTPLHPAQYPPQLTITLLGGARASMPTAFALNLCSGATMASPNPGAPAAVCSYVRPPPPGSANGGSSNYFWVAGPW